MNNPIRLILALFFFVITVKDVMHGNALLAVLSATCATYWLVTWLEEE